MKKDVELLWELQNLEELTKKERDISEIGEMKELKELKRHTEYQKNLYDEKKASVEKLKKELRGLEKEAEDLKAKVADSNHLLYQESDNSAKELEQLQKKIEQLSHQLNIQEDKVISCMQDLEDQERLLGNIKSQLEAMVREFRKRYAAYQIKKEKAEETHEQIKHQIAELKKQISKEILARFEQERNRFSDRKPIALITNDSCEGCNMVISFDLKKRLKNENGSVDLVCENCGRIVFEK